MRRNHPPTARHIRLCEEAAARLIPLLRQVARDLGYALGEHGTKQFDIDLIACPWSEIAVSTRGLADALHRAIEEVHGFAFCTDAAEAANPEYFLAGSPGNKPHGRRVWTWHLGGGPYIDLSVMPRYEGDEKYEDPRTWRAGR